jgi:hypothetical protein
MANESLQPTHWAVLVGVGVTVRPEQGSQNRLQDLLLKGAVQDVITINEYLLGSMSAIDITMLTATKALDDVHVRAKEAAELLPTVDNLESSFKRIIDLGNPGDHVYIHYSGHGIHRPADGALALELVHPNNFEVRYFYGTKLRNAINCMLKKKLSVILVLDCCFSGSVLRTDGIHRSIRYLKHDKAIDEQSMHISQFGDNTETRFRGAEIKFPTLLDPDGYTIITACGSDEFAVEINQAGLRMGALSYFLVDSLTALKKRGVNISNQTLHQHLRARLHAHHPQQTPMLYGKSGFSFFRDFNDDSSLTIVSAHRNVDDGCLILNAGLAHGVHQADEYALYPFDTPEDPGVMTSHQALKSKVDLVHGVNSNLVTVDPQDLEKIKKGSAWKATLLMSFSSRKTKIRLLPPVPERHKLVEAANNHPFLILSAGSEEIKTQAPVFQVDVNNEHIYEVQDATFKKVFNLPSIACTPDGNHNAMLNMLGHIAKFKFFEGIENCMSSGVFDKSFRLYCKDIPGEDGFYEVEHGKSITLKFENLSSRTLYLAIFIFTPLWDITNMVFAKGEGTCLAISPKGDVKSGEAELGLDMAVSSELQRLGQLQTDDIVKVFVTSLSSVFPETILPQFGWASPRREVDQVVTLLQRLNSGIPGTRVDERYEWATRNYFIRTSIKSPSGQSKATSS